MWRTSLYVTFGVLCALRALGCSFVAAPSDGAFTPRRLAAQHLSQVFEVGEGLYSGSSPEGARGMDVLQKLGIKTIISVDGAAPDAEAARAAGMRYVHLPIGYDGIEPERLKAILKAARELPRPLYVHCHHGKHRGPTAAAVIAVALEGWSREQARQWMCAAGTSPDYQGLYQTVASFDIPTPEELAALEVELPERAQVPELAEAMVCIDECWERLVAVRDADFDVPSEHPDVDPPHEALQLVEYLHELGRTESARMRGAGFKSRLAEEEREARALYAWLVGRKAAPAGAAVEEGAQIMARLAQGCKQCHKQYRNP